MKILAYKLGRGLSLILLTFSLWLDLICDEFIIRFKSERQRKNVLDCGRVMFWESFKEPNIIWDDSINED